MSRHLKLSMLACGLILAAAGGMGLQTAQRLAVARERNAHMVSEAAALGIAAGSSGKESPVVFTKRQREAREELAKRELAEIRAMIEVVDATGKKEGVDTGVDEEQILLRLMSLSPAGAGLVMGALIEDKTIDRDGRRALLGFLLMKVATDDPPTLFKLLPKLSGLSGDEKGDKRDLETVSAIALGNWGKTDPEAALAWIRSHEESFSGSLDEGVKQKILTGAASRDPAKAFALLGEMEIKDRKRAVASILRGAKGPEGRSAALAALRAHVASSGAGENGEILDAGIGQLAEKSFREGFGPASKWLGEAGLGPAGMTTAGSRLEYYHTIGETGQWLGWLGQGLPPDKAGEPVSRIMKRWTEVDYRAAGEWLAAAPEGPARSASIRTYAGMISAHEPETAVKWAMLLPAGEERDDTLKQIHQNWPKDQASARDAFAKEHGIE